VVRDNQAGQPVSSRCGRLGRDRAGSSMHLKTLARGTLKKLPELRPGPALCRGQCIDKDLAPVSAVRGLSRAPLSARG